MTVALVSYELPKSMSLKEAHKIFVGTSNKYRAMPDLLRKYYLFADDGGSVGAFTCGSLGRLPKRFITKNGSSIYSIFMGLNQPLNTSIVLLLLIIWLNK